MDIAKEAGFTFSAEELQAAQETMELSDEELEGGVAGGACWNRCRTASCLNA